MNLVARQHDETEFKLMPSSLQDGDFGGRMRWAGRPGMEEKNEYTIIMD